MADVDTSVRQNARARLMELDEYAGIPRPRRGVYDTRGRGVQGESSN